jgi:hypothetical protein
LRVTPCAAACSLALDGLITISPSRKSESMGKAADSYRGKDRTSVVLSTPRYWRFSALVLSADASRMLSSALCSPSSLRAFRESLSTCQMLSLTFL